MQDIVYRIQEDGTRLRPPPARPGSLDDIRPVRLPGISGKSCMGLKIPTLRFKVLLELDPLKSSIILGRRLAVRPVRLLRVWISEGLTKADS